eukprot:GILJ01028538.1.p1 GENE.GILJ01028538.1~~GILJ01028538.1.p1  ORF type:complete len:115 (-),score=1.98 GILJ01028538.1:53-397(-)
MPGIIPLAPNPSLPATRRCTRVGKPPQFQASVDHTATWWGGEDGSLVSDAGAAQYGLVLLGTFADNPHSSHHGKIIIGATVFLTCESSSCLMKACLRGFYVRLQKWKQVMSSAV